MNAKIITMGINFRYRCSGFYLGFSGLALVLKFRLRSWASYSRPSFVHAYPGPHHVCLTWKRPISHRRAATEILVDLDQFDLHLLLFWSIMISILVLFVSSFCLSISAFFNVTIAGETTALLLKTGS